MVSCVRFIFKKSKPTSKGYKMPKKIPCSKKAYDEPQIHLKTVLSFNSSNWKTLEALNFVHNFCWLTSKLVSDMKLNLGPFLISDQICT